MHNWLSAAAAAKSLQSCLTLCHPIDGSPPGSPVSGILQARTLEWVAISFSNTWKWKWSHSVVSDSLRPHGLEPTRLLHPLDFPGKSTGVGCHCLLRTDSLVTGKFEMSSSWLLFIWLLENLTCITIAMKANISNKSYAKAMNLLNINMNIYHCNNFPINTLFLN